MHGEKWRPIISTPYNFSLMPCYQILKKLFLLVLSSYFLDLFLLQSNVALWSSSGINCALYNQFSITPEFVRDYYGSYTHSPW